MQFENMREVSLISNLLADELSERLDGYLVSADTIGIPVGCQSMRNHRRVMRGAMHIMRQACEAGVVFHERGECTDKSCQFNSADGLVRLRARTIQHLEELEEVLNLLDRHDAEAGDEITPEPSPTGIIAGVEALQQILGQAPTRGL